MQKPVMGGAVAEGDLHRSILHNITCGDEGKKRNTTVFLLNPRFLGSFWSSHLGARWNLCVWTWRDFHWNAAHFKKPVLTGLLHSTDIAEFENGHSNHTRYKEFLNPSCPVDNNTGGRLILWFVFKAWTLKERPFLAPEIQNRSAIHRWKLTNRCDLLSV